MWLPMWLAPLLHRRTGGIPEWLTYVVVGALYSIWIVMYELPLRRKAARENAEYKKAFAKKVALAEAQLFGAK